MQEPYIRMLLDEYGEQMDIVQVPAQPWEVKGVARLEEMQQFLFGS